MYIRCAPVHHKTTAGTSLATGPGRLHWGHHSPSCPLSHAHLSQPLQKIVLNHLQLVSLAASFPLKWPPALETMFDWQAMVGRASEYMFNPQCVRGTKQLGNHLSSASDSQEMQSEEGVRPFFMKQLLTLLLPIFALIGCTLFWFAVYLGAWRIPPFVGRLFSGCFRLLCPEKDHGDTSKSGLMRHDLFRGVGTRGQIDESYVSVVSIDADRSEKSATFIIAVFEVYKNYMFVHSHRFCYILL